MKTPLKTALLGFGLALASTAAHAAANDLILGFNEQGVSSFDYTINLGNYLSSVGVGGGSVVDLSSHIGPLNAANGFNASFAGGPTGVSVGVVGGNNGVGTKDVFATSLRLTLANPPNQPGSTIPTTLSSGTLINSAGAIPAGFNSFGQLSSGDSASWSSLIAANSTDTTTPGTYSGILQYNPMSVISGSTIVEDLWQNNRSGTTGPALGWVYDGYFTLSFLDANNASLTFTPVPEPTTGALLGGLGLLVLCFRRQIRR